MRRKFCPLFAVILLTIITLWQPFSPAHAQTIERELDIVKTPSQPLPSNQPKYAPDRVIVKYKPGKTKNALSVKVAQRETQAQSFLGFVIQKGGDFVSSTIGGRPLPEDELRKIENVENRFHLRTKPLEQQMKAPNLL